MLSTSNTCPRAASPPSVKMSPCLRYRPLPPDAPLPLLIHIRSQLGSVLLPPHGVVDLVAHLLHLASDLSSNLRRQERGWRLARPLKERNCTFYCDVRPSLEALSGSGNTGRAVFIDLLFRPITDIPPSPPLTNQLTALGSHQLGLGKCSLIGGRDDTYVKYIKGSPEIPWGRKLFVSLQ